MILAILSDIHSNLEALRACLDKLERRGIEKMACLGDIVGYGADPEACCDLVRDWPGAMAVAGNHDTAVSGAEPYEDFYQDARTAVQINRALLSPRNLEWLKGLPKSQVFGNLFFVHGSPSHPTREYLLDSAGMKKALADIREQACFVGHSHSPFAFRCGPGSSEELLEPGRPRVMEMDPSARYVINPGAVGQPRDGDPRASFAILDEQTAKLEFVRLKYDVAAAQAKMREKEIPEYLIRRLERGR